MRKLAPGLLIAACLAVTTPSAGARETEPSSPPSTAVIATVSTRDEARIQQLAREHDLLGYRWRDGVAVIADAADRLPPDATIDAAAMAGLAALAGGVAKGGGIPGFPCYRTIAETYASLAALAAAHPTLATWESYGESWERTEGLGGHELRSLVISNQAIPGPKPVLMIMAAMHPRELVTAEAATRFAEWLLAGYGTDGDRSWMVDHLAIHILPQHNPDGRTQVEQGEALWRKNTNEAYCANFPTSRGADLNRNAATLFWGGAGASGNACSERYSGPSPTSEPETAALEAHIAAVFPDQRDGALTVGAPDDASGIFISLHSFGEYVFYPWEGDDIDTGNEAGYRALTQRMAALTGYASCQNCCLGTVGGTSVDQVYEAVGAASLTIEVGTSFQQSCQSFEAQVWPEALTLFRYAARAARRPYLSSFAPHVTALTAVAEADGSIRLAATANGGDYGVNHECSRQDPVLGARGVARILLTIEEPPWSAAETIELAPDDGAWGDVLEAGVVSLPAALFDAGASALVFAFAEDAAGDRGPPRAIIVRAELLFDDGFEPPG